VDYVKDTCQDLGWKLYVVEPKRGQSYEDFVAKFGFPHSGIHQVVMGFLKWFPIRKFAKEHGGVTFVSGRRPKESKRRMRIAKAQFEHPEKWISLESALFTWSDADVWAYLKKNELKRCPVYETMHMSGDCMCGAFSDLGEAELLATFHGVMASKIRDLEKKYGGQWGNQSSMTGAMNQSKIESFICQDCIIRNR
jgi:3'-phosphoadenosine 5'-phosphosulfate sulfotransferase (PAPS reductase)/FAD synthetase